MSLFRANYSKLDLSEYIGEVNLANSAFSLSSIHGFPESEWHSRRMVYEELDQWYDGTKLNEKQTQGGRQVDKYPIKLNPIRGAVYKHTHALFGEAKDDSKPLAVPILRPDDRKLKEQARLGQNFLFRVWYENHGRSMMLRTGMQCQVYGGSVIKLSYVPDQKWRTIPLRVENVHPGNFVGIPMAGDEFRLAQAWVVKAISPAEAFQLYGIAFPENEPVYYVEYWEPNYYEVTVNGNFIKTGQVDSNGADIYYQGDHTFGCVPLVYIPHIRISDWYGDSMITPNVQGIVEELNKRVADYGDAVSDDSHRYYKVINSSSRPDVYELAPGVRVIQLTPNPSFTGKEGQPDIDQLGSAQASEAMRGLTEELYNHFRREAFIPAVADGEDEGSQRSALTLAMRMWPLLSHTAQERILWGDALNLLDGYMLKIASDLAERDGIESEYIKGLPKECADMRIERRWAPALPRDREVFINELVNRASANLGSLEHLISLLDDVEDPEGEYQAIIKQMKDLAAVEMEKIKLQAELRPDPVAQGQGAKPKATSATSATSTPKQTATQPKKEKSE